MRLIDADVAIHILNESIAINRTDVAMGLRLAMYEIDMMPTIDAVPVVRCEKCKWFDYGTTCIRFGIRMSRAHDDFCSYGKGKADE